MKQQLKTRQTGISFFGLVIVMIVLALVALVGAQVLPTAVEYSAIQRAVNKAAKEGNSVAEVRGLFDKSANIDAITSITGQDLAISKEGDRMAISFAYDKEIHLVGPAFLLLKYAGHSRLMSGRE